MKSEKIIRNHNVGGDLGAATAEVMKTEGLQAGNNALPKNAVMINSSMLPSKGKFYSAPIYATPLSAKNLKDLSNMSEDNANAAINLILAERIIGIRHTQLLQADKLWLIFYLRSITYDDHPIKLKYTCSECKHQGVKRLHLADLTVNYYDESADMSLLLPISGDTLTLRYPTLFHEKQGNDKKNDTQLVDAVDPDLIDISEFIEAVNGEHKTVYEAYQYVCAMHPRDFNKFTNYMIKHNIGLNPVAEFECECGATTKEMITFTSDFFNPDDLDE